MAHPTKSRHISSLGSPDEHPVKCPECDSENPRPAFFCNQCGAALYRQADQEKKRAYRATLRTLKRYLLLLILAAGFLLVGFWFALRTTAPIPEMDCGTESLAVIQEPIADPPGLSAKKQEPPLPAPAIEKMPQKSEPVFVEASQPPVQPVKEVPKFTLTTRMVAVLNPWGQVVNKIPVVVVAGGWMALPTRPAIGGNRFILGNETPDKVDLEGGLWLPRDMIGLWRVQGEVSLNSPALQPWSKNLPLHWLSLRTGQMHAALDIAPYAENGYYLNCHLPEWLNEFGLFIQDNKVVGWTFGPLLADGFLWDGDIEKVTEYESFPADFYRHTFAGGREEQFAKALALDNNTPVADRLQMVVAGFRLAPKLTENETPAELGVENMLHFLDTLLSQAMEQGRFNELVKIFDGETLKALGNVGLLFKIIPATIKVAGYAEAIRLARDVGPALHDISADNQARFDKLLSESYWSFIGELMEERDLPGAWLYYGQAKELFPESPEIHLSGVQLSLAAGDWQEAERLLYAREYPASFAELVQVLGNRISELKSQEGKIVIRFQPGTMTIPVTALINGLYEQHFIVDTGASMVSIPSSTVQALGMTVDEHAPVHFVSTAGGVTAAYEIKLGSIELGDWVVNNLNALVMDIPGQPNLGLLGLNFLNHFRMELDTDKGILLLSPL